MSRWVLPLKGSPGVVGPGFCMASDARDRDRVQGSVECPVAATVEAMPGALTAAGFQGWDSGQRGECRFASDPYGVGPADQQLGRDDRSDAWFGE